MRVFISSIIIVAAFLWVNVAEAFWVKARCGWVYGERSPTTVTEIEWYETLWNPTLVSVNAQFSHPGSGTNINHSSVEAVPYRTHGIITVYVSNAASGFWTIAGQSSVVQFPAFSDTDYTTCTV